MYTCTYIYVYMCAFVCVCVCLCVFARVGRNVFVFVCLCLHAGRKRMGKREVKFYPKREREKVFGRDQTARKLVHVSNTVRNSTRRITETTSGGIAQHDAVVFDMAQIQRKPSCCTAQKQGQP